LRVTGPFKEGTFLRFNVEAEGEEALELAYFGLLSRVEGNEYVLFLPLENVQRLKSSQSPAAQTLLSHLPAEYVSLPEDLKRKFQEASKILSFARYVVEKALSDDSVLVQAPAGEGVARFLSRRGVEHKAAKDGVVVDARKILEVLGVDDG